VAVVGFREATAVRRAEGHEGSYEVELDPEWTVGGRPHGGYLLALMARAAIADDDAGTHPHPLSSSAVYMAPPETGAATVSVEPLRRGRTVSHLRARLVQADRPCVEALFTLGHLGTGTGVRFVATTPPPVRPELDLPRSPVQPDGFELPIAMLGVVDQRVDWTGGEPGDLRGWLRLADGQPWDALSLLYAADSFPPASLTLGSVGWAPTLEYTVYVRAEPVAGPLRVRQRARLLAGNLLDQVCELWDSADRVVAQASQLASVRMG
jgi:hypothetical protein